MDRKLLVGLKRYGFAVALPGLAVTLRSVLPFPEGAGIYQLPLAAVIVAAWYGGRGPGWLASAISVVGAMYLLPPAGSFAVHSEHVLPLSIFAALCLLITEFGAGRRLVEQALRESEARFRKLTELSVDGYWKQDENLRFTFAMDERHGFEARSLGKTRWELPFTPLSTSWDEHRAVLTARKPFYNFEYSRVHPDGTTRYISVSGVPAFDDQGAFKGYDGVASDITARKLAEAERRANVWFLESMDRINRAMQGTSDLEKMMSDVLEAALEIFACDRAWLLHPCEPDARFWRAVMEHTRPEYPGVFALGASVPTDSETAAIFAAALGSRGPVRLGPGEELQVPADIAERFTIRSAMAIALRPKGERPYLFGLHQCSGPRTWTKDEQRLFDEIGHRLTDALASLIAIRSLRESEARLETAQRVAHVGWWERDYATAHVSLSDEACRIFGVQPLELPQWHGRWMSLIHPEDRDRAAAASDRALRGGPRYDVEYRVVRPDGTERVIHSQGDVTRDESGRAIRQFGVLQDITELRQMERRLEAAQRVAHVGWWERDYAGGRMLVSDVVAEIYGIADQPRVIDLAEWMKLLPTIIHPQDYPRALAASEAALRGGPRYDMEYRVVHRDGTVRVVHSQADVTRVESGRPVRQFGVAQDITELRQAEQELRASEARFRTFVDHATDAFFLHDQNLTLVDVNRQACESLGYTREELIGMHPREFDAGLSEASVAQIADRVGGGETVTFETLHRRKNGIVFPVEIRARKFDTREKRFHLSFARDISERKLAEETLRDKDNALQMARTELARVSRLTTLGELTASIAHEVNQPLGAMVTNAAACARWLAAKPPDMEEARAALDNIVSDGKRAGEVIARIRGLTKREMPRMELLDVNRKVMEVVALAEHELRSQDIVLRTDLDRALPPVAGDRVQLQQVLLNLIVNAIEAMSGVQDRPRELTIASARSDANAVVVEVRDSGPGFKQESTERVFEPFYTTKAQGIGIGLSISRSIVEAHGGRLWAMANSPHGAVFRFTLPVADEAAA